MRLLLLHVLVLLLATAGACAAVTGMMFANGGGPKDSVGVWWSPEDPITGIQTTGPAVYTFMEDGQLVAEFGTYMSYECVPNKAKGAYQTILEVRKIYPDGRQETETRCEVGTNDVAAGQSTWNDSPDACPTDFTANKLTLLESSLSKRSNMQECP